MAPGNERRIYRDGPTDSTRWERFQHRPGDIVIATPAKCGTTWMQTIVASLLFPDGQLPGPVVLTSPWLDGRLEPIDSVLERLEKQSHRRFVKTHTPADGVPWWPTASYIVVLRDGRDAFMSLINHMAKMRREVVSRVASEAEKDGGQPLHWSGDPHEDFPCYLENDEGALAYLASWWPRRHEKNLLLVHYNDLKADLDAEMRRIAEFLGLSLPDALWPGVVERCTFEAMKARPNEIGPFEFVFEGGVDSFLFKGTNGRWREVLTADEIRLYEERVAALLPDDAAAWLAGGFRGAMDP